ncbi:hypothetical protein ACIO8F_29555 [Streptomyces sp. NPDC087228]|uniref:hypothetical protein n=1 Tax=unclassified Streptomyces TaxID=2593676 RepID=UPI003827AFBA
MTAERPDSTGGSGRWVNPLYVPSSRLELYGAAEHARAVQGSNKRRPGTRSYVQMSSVTIASAPIRTEASTAAAVPRAIEPKSPDVRGPSLPRP